MKVISRQIARIVDSRVRRNLIPAMSTATSSPVRNGAMNGNESALAARARLFSSGVSKAPLKPLDEKLPPNEARERYRLEDRTATRRRERKAKRANEIATLLRQGIERIDTLKAEYKDVRLGKTIRELKESGRQPKKLADLQELEGIRYLEASGIRFIPGDSRKIQVNKFTNTLEYLVQTGKFRCSLEDNELKALVAYEYTDKYLDSLPSKIKDEIEECETTLLRYYFFNKRRLLTARSIETVESFHKEVADGKLRPALENESPERIVEILCPDSMQGKNPKIRPWLLPGVKWSGEDAEAHAQRACTWVLVFGEKLYSLRSGKLNVKEIRKRNWGEVLISHGLKGMLSGCEEANNNYKAVKLGVRGLNDGSLEKLIQPHVILHRGMWTEKSGHKKTIDCVTDELVDNLRINNPELFEAVDANDHGSGKFKVKEARSFFLRDEYSLPGEYNRLANDCLRSAGMNAVQALRRRHPYLFGFGEFQIKSWEALIERGWDNKAFFRTAALYSFHATHTRAQPGLGTLSIDDNRNLSLTFTDREFDAWWENIIEKRYHHDIVEFFTSKHLSGGFKIACNTNAENLTRLIFDIPADKPLPSLACSRSQITKATIVAVVKEKGGSVTIPLAKLTKLEQEILEDELKRVKKKVVTETSNNLNDVDYIRRRLYAFNVEPFNGGMPAFKGKTGALPRFDCTNTLLNGLLENEPSSTVIRKVTDTLISSELFDERRESPFLIQTLVNKKRRESYVLSERDIRDFFTILKEVLSDFDLKDVSKKDLEDVIQTVLDMKGGIRQNISDLTDSSVSERLRERGSHKSRNIGVIILLLNHIVYSTVLKDVQDKKRERYFSSVCEKIPSNVVQVAGQITDGIHRKTLIALASEVPEYDNFRDQTRDAGRRITGNPRFMPNLELTTLAAFNSFERGYLKSLPTKMLIPNADDFPMKLKVFWRAMYC